LFERYEAGEKAVLVHVNFSDESEREDLAELVMLVESAGAAPLATVTASRASPHPKYFVGTGKAEEIAEVARQQQADVIIFNHPLSPAQERNLEQLCQCRVLDRISLILDIFAQRARTHEGKLQVELAQLRHLSTRLVRGWTHLERQKGGIGLRGPGETQLETDRRLLRGRIKHILRRLERVQKQREQGRRARRRAEIPTLSLVGYTNAGKSTLFNRLTQSGVYAADQLFATLDPTLRKLDLDELGSVIFADTVGFIRHLPHELIAAFKATLQETQEAELLLHVVDCADERLSDNIQQVQVVLDEINADEVPQLLVYNKIDQLEQGRPRVDRDERGEPVRVWLSALTGDGMELLLDALKERLAVTMVAHRLQLPMSAGKLRSTLYQLHCVEREGISDDGKWLLDVRMPRIEWLRLEKREGDNLRGFIATR